MCTFISGPGLMTMAISQSQVSMLDRVTNGVTLQNMSGIRRCDVAMSQLSLNCLAEYWAKMFSKSSKEIGCRKRVMDWSA